MKKYLFVVLFFLLISIILLCCYYKTDNFENKTENRFENKLSLLCVFKNETMNMKVWLDHYINQGVEKFYLIDNDSTDNPLEILQPYIDKGIVNYFYRPEKYKQNEHTKEIIISENLKDKTEWLIICDADEFFYGYPKKLSLTLEDDFSGYEAIISQWRNFGSGGYEKHPENITKSILNRRPDFGKEKYIVKPSAIKNIDDVYVHEIYNVNSTIENDKIRINHYVIQSKEFYEKVKMDRGDACHPGANDKHNWGFFKTYDDDSTVYDDVLANI